MKSWTLNPLILKSFLLLLAGWAIYSFQRPDGYPYLVQLHPGTEFLKHLPNFVKHNLPSLLHVWAMSLMTAAAMPQLFLRNPTWAPGLWLSINIIFEAGQALDKNSTFLQALPQELAHYFIQGRFDGLDVLACVGGALLAMRTLGFQSPSLRTISEYKTRMFSSACIVFGLFSIMATSRHPSQVVTEPYPGYDKPIYMPYDEFRASFEVLPPAPIAAPGKIFVKDHLLLINDINRGVHIIDNQNPAEPKPLAFLKILGSRDIAVFDHYLYVDSFVDFLVIDLQDPAGPQLIQRIEDIFPWQPEVWFSDPFLDADPDKGMVIGIESRSSSYKQEN